MASEIIKTGTTITYTHSAAVVAGVPIVVEGGTSGAMFLIPAETYASGVEGEYFLGDGQWIHDKKSADDFTPGDTVFWHKTNGQCEIAAVPGQTIVIGKAIETSASGATTLRVAGSSGLAVDVA